jgi:hypothetical protein
MRLPVFLDSDDRRYAVCKTLKDNQIPSDVGRSIKRWAADEGGAAAIRYYLEHVDICDFDPTANPPWTEDKTRLVSDSRSSLLTFAHNLMADDERPSIATMSDLLWAAKGELGSDPALKALSNALDDAGAVALPRVRINPGGRKQSVWSLRGTFSDLSEKALRARLQAEATTRSRFFGEGGSKY